MDNIKLLDSINKDKKVFYDELRKVIIGQDKIIEHIFIAILCRGHVLLEGVPGLGKTLIIKTISDIMDLNFSRIQFTPDLMPSDITGSEIISKDAKIVGTNTPNVCDESTFIDEGMKMIKTCTVNISDDSHRIGCNPISRKNHGEEKFTMEHRRQLRRKMRNVKKRPESYVVLGLI